MFTWIEKVIAGKESLVLFISNLRFWFAAVSATRTKFLDHLTEN